VRDGEVRAAPEGTRVPKWIRDEIVRGLMVEPSARHPSMDALLDALARALVDPRAVQRSWVRRLALVLPIVAVAVAVGVVLGAQKEPEAVVVTEVVPGEPPPPQLVPGPSVPVPTPAKADTKVAAVAPKPAPPKDPPAPAPAPAPKKGAICYVDEDDGKLVAQRKGKKAQLFVRDRAANCWECPRRPSAITDLTYPGCATYRACRKLQDPAKCTG